MRRTRFSKSLQWLWFWVAAGGLCCSTGCRTGGTFAPLDLSRGWEMRSGQAVWQPGRGKTEIAGEVTLARHPQGQVWLAFSKSPFSIAEVRREPGRWLAVFGGTKTYSGRGAPPARIAWLQLAGALTGGSPAPGWHFSKTPDGSWVLEHARTGERISGYLEEKP